MSPMRQTPVWGHEAYAATGSGGGLCGSARAFGWTVNSLMVMFFSCTWTSCHQSNFLLLKKKKKELRLQWALFLAWRQRGLPISFSPYSQHEPVNSSFGWGLVPRQSLTYRFHFCKLERDAFYLKRFKGALLRGALFHKCMPGCGVWWWLMILITPACDYPWSRASVSPGFHLGMDLLKADFGGGHSNPL